MRITGKVRIKNQQWRYDPETGWLRCTAVLLQNSVMPYQRAELKAPHDVRPTEDTLYIWVPPEALADPDSLASLEGTPVVAGAHVWQTGEEDTNRCGSIAGRPYVDGDDLVADILVTDRDAAQRIMLPAGDPERLEELSTGFDGLVEWMGGLCECGPYDGRFSQIRYNHTAILRAGEARGGSSVRIVNTSEHPTMPMEFTRIRLRNGKFVRVVNEDVPAVEEDQAATEAETKNSVDAGKVNELMDQVTQLNQQIADLTAERDKAAGELLAVKEQLDAALDTSAIEAAAEGLAAERADADTVMNARGKQLTAEQRKLRGHDLRVAVINSVRATALTEEQAKNPALVEGMYIALRDATPAAAVKPPSVAAVVNSQPAPIVAAVPQDFDAIRARQYPGHFGGEKK